MQGAIFLEFRTYVNARFGSGAWRFLHSAAALDEPAYEVLGDYPDSDAVALVTAAAHVTGRTPSEVFEDFGMFIAPHLLEMFWGCVDPTWTTLDVIKNTEETIHRVVRLRNASAKPPRLNVTRVSANEVVIEYCSERKMCALAKGIARGLAVHFDERVVVLESECMLRGADRCVIAVRLER